ncbi:MAG: hypothetical protein WBD62_11335, partial [Anaerolineales bacterium]
MKKFIKVILLLFSLLIIMSFEMAPAISAQSTNDGNSIPGPTTIIRLDPQVRQRYEPPPAVFLNSLAAPEQAAAATIMINYNGGGWTSEAQDAFRFAADIWETLITSPVPIVVDAEFAPMGENILGGAGPTSIRRNFTNAPQANTWYP